MKYIICDLDGTLADDSHRRDYLSKRKIFDKTFPGYVFDSSVKELVDDPPVSTLNPDQRRLFDEAVSEHWDKFYLACEYDLPIIETITIWDSLINSCIAKYEIWSGRGSISLEKTINWLSKHEVNYDNLRMRKIDDYRPDTKLKKEWLEEIGGPENVLFIIDDRQVMVDFWKDSGIHVFQIHKPGISNIF